MTTVRDAYLKKLKERAKKSHVYKKHQLTGLRIGEELNDRKHKGLYMKLAKEGNPAKLEWLAADVASRENIKNKGAYFMAALLKTEKEAKAWLKRKPTKKQKRGNRAKNRLL